jgi:hypothetical protein
MMRPVVTTVATMLAVVSLILWADVELLAQTRLLSLNVGDSEEDFGVELIEGASPINPAATRYCVRLPAGVTKRTGETPMPSTGSASSAVASAGARASGAAPAGGPTAWIQLEASSASLYYVNAEGGVDGAQWGARPPRMFIRRDEKGRISVCVGKPGMLPPTIP